MSLAKDKRLTRIYGVPEGWYRQTLKDQGWGCAICGKPPKPGRRLHVDHDHSPPWVVRGLLDWKCNKLLGVARDNALVLLEASRYLRKHQSPIKSPSPLYCCPKPIKRRRRKKSKTRRKKR